VMERGVVGDINFTYGPNDRFRITANPDHTVTYQQFRADAFERRDLPVITKPATALPAQLVGHVGIKLEGNWVSQARMQGVFGPTNLAEPAPDEFDAAGVEIDDPPSDELAADGLGGL